MTPVILEQEESEEVLLLFFFREGKLEIPKANGLGAAVSQLTLRWEGSAGALMFMQEVGCPPHVVFLEGGVFYAAGTQM